MISLEYVDKKKTTKKHIFFFKLNINYVENVLPTIGNHSYFISIFYLENILPSPDHHNFSISTFYM